MDSAKLILTEAVSPPNLLESFSKTSAVTDKEKIQAAKDFESVLINKLLDQMNNSIGEWGFEKDEASKQIQGIFTLYLSRYVADNGGFGLWKDIYKFLTHSIDTTAESLDSNV
ncbi:MAG: hypothetical protein ACYS1A_06175 [Planctomycetota bacterium]|jgi:Rod binding domain-containing protein